MKELLLPLFQQSLAPVKLQSLLLLLLFQQSSVPVKLRSPLL
jgi:hypothetical protein